MNLFSYSDIKTKLQNDMDVQDLDFLNGETELLGYINEALRDAQAEVHTLGLDAVYFLSIGTITLVNGTQDYVLPADIFANRIKKVFYINGQKKYEIFRVRDLRQVPFIQAGDDYQYLLLVTTGTANNNRIRFLPTPAEAGAVIQVYYIRNVTTMTTSTSDAANVCEIPEAVNYVFQLCKCRIYEKMGNPNLPEAVQVLAAQRQLMIDTLREMVPDENTIIQPDMAFYEDCYMDLRRDF